MSLSGQKNPHRASYWKTVWIASISALTALVLANVALIFGRGFLMQAVGLVFWLTFFAAVAIFAGGLVVLYRDSREALGKPDMFVLLLDRKLKINARDGNPIKKLVRPLLGAGLRPGDLVQVRSPHEILATLDTEGKVNRLPFMPELLNYCGKVFRVHRKIDKIHDMITRTGLRRMKNVVTLQGVRCDGSGHGGCQAECQILWNEKWLRPYERTAEDTSPVQKDEFGISAQESMHGQVALHELVSGAARHQSAPGSREASTFMCQITELTRASEPMAAWDIRQDLRPLLNGNVSILAFGLVTLTWIFNRCQTIRGGVHYPISPAQPNSGRTPVEYLDLQAGESVIIKSKEEIASTLVRNHNRGMWFGTETQRFCNQKSKVRFRVNRIIDERTGEMLEMKIPCLVLDNCMATGEFLRFCPQNEHVFWREIWLRRMGN